MTFPVCLRNIGGGGHANGRNCLPVGYAGALLKVATFSRNQPFHHCIQMLTYSLKLISIILSLPIVLFVQGQFIVPGEDQRHRGNEWFREEDYVSSNFHHQQHRKPMDVPSSSAFIQQAGSPSWSVSYNPDQDGQIRPYRRFVYDVPRFARPPDPHSLRADHLKNAGEESLELFDGAARPEIPQALRNYFSLDATADKVVKELTGVDLRSLIGPAMDQLTTPAPTWTRATTPKDKLVGFFERSLDDFLSGRFRPMERIPYLLENEKLLEVKNQTTETPTDVDGLLEGSGEAPEDAEQQPEQLASSIAGIPKQMPFIPKVPLHFSRQEDPGIVSKFVDMKKPEEKGKEKAAADDEPLTEIRRHPVAAAAKQQKDTRRESAKELLMAKTMREDFQYGAKPSYQQGVLGSVLDFFGIKSPENGELDQVLTDWLMEHSPQHLTKMERRANKESSHAIMKRLLSQPVMPMCAQQPQVIGHFDVDALMGQWFEVMSSPLMASPSCTVLSYRMLSRTGQPNAVGSLFQTLQLSLPKRTSSFALGGDTSPPQKSLLTSGYAFVSRPGQMVFRKSDSPEEVHVQVIDAGFSPGKGRYEWAILGINCNYPLYVIARDPLLFKQKYERLVIQTLEQKGLISELSRLLNLVSAVNPDSCQVPANVFV